MKKSKKQSLPEFYKDIDAPIYIWDKIHSTSDLSWLLMKRKKLNKSLAKTLETAWENIYNQYLSEFGFSENFKTIIAKKVEVAQMKLELIITGDRTLLTFIEIEEEILSSMEKGNTKADFMDSKIAIESKFKFQINMMATSIREFYSYLKHLK